MTDLETLLAHIDLKTVLSDVTIAMSIAIAILHVVRVITTRLRAYALTTPEKWDDAITSRVLHVLDGLDAIVDAVSLAIPRPPRPLERESNR
jgi:hypothetical protein